ncbi:MAG: primosomal protein N' [Deltaproteobacteria bacterium]|nr:primosomal protein N' [Deltaproteobacteria bacterium]
MFVRVAINIPADKTFSYEVPATLERDVAVGKRALVPFGNRKLTGYILEITATATYENTKEIIEVLDPAPLFDGDDLKFYEWIARYYLHPLGKTLGELLPSGTDIKSDTWLCLAGDTESSPPLSTAQKTIVAALRDHPQGLTLSRLKKRLGRDNINADIRCLREMNMLFVEDRLLPGRVTAKKGKIVALCPKTPIPPRLTSKQSAIADFLSQQGDSPLTLLAENFPNASALIKRMAAKGIVRTTEEEVLRRPAETPHFTGSPIASVDRKIVLNKQQEAACEEILKCLASERFSPCLLHGVTGSGKTEVYLSAIEEAVRMNGGVIFLVPEIALTPQLISRIGDRLCGVETAILHSGIPEGVRYDEWRRIRRGDVRVVIGARSALFAPVRNLTLIIVDEEHDTSYKQDERLRYNARDMAIVKAQLTDATVVLGSATPGIQTYFNSKGEKYRYLSLTDRFEDRPLPHVEIVDMKKEREIKEQLPILSRSLEEELRQVLDHGNQALLFLNRRGFNTFMICSTCGHAFRCLNCELALTHHAGEGVLKCHYCDFTIKAPPLCPNCRDGRVKSYGVGTERLEEEVKRIFPTARVARMDSDTTARRGAHAKILHALHRQDIDVLVGTQMIAKGHDFPGITLVGVISADTSLNIPDFRAAERTFQLLTQVAGRSGRGDEPGKVIIQTFNPDHYAIMRAETHDYKGFYADELPLRRALLYPPFSRMVNLHFSSINRDRGLAAVENAGNIARKLAVKTAKKEDIEVIGPAEAPIAKIRNRHRWQLLLKGKNINSLHTLARDILSQVAAKGVDIRVDVDPVSFM